MAVSTKPARGMRDFLPDDVRRRQYVIGVIADVYQSYGFEPLETPAVENIETLIGKYGEEGDQLIFKILKRGEDGETGEADLALRYDLTVPLARVVAEHRAQLPKFFKRYQIQPVWRADRPQKGRFREFYQCDVDAIGSTSMMVEAELLRGGADVLARLGFTDFTIRLNHRQLLAGDARRRRRAARRCTATALVALDKLDKIGRDGVVDGDGGARHRRRRPRRWSALLRPAATAARQRRRGSTRLGRAMSAATTAGARGAWRELREILRADRAATSAGPHLQVDADAGARAGVLHRRDLRDRRRRPGRQPRRRRPLRQPGRHVPRPAGAGLRHSRSGLERILVVMGERGMFPAAVERAAGRRAGGQLRRRRGGRTRWRSRRRAAAPTARLARRGLSGRRQARQAVQVRRRARHPVRRRARRRRSAPRGDRSR